MPAIVINATAEQIKAVEGIVMDATEWCQAAFDGKANNCTARVIEEYTDKNAGKLTGQQQKDLVATLPIVKRKDK